MSTLQGSRSRSPLCRKEGWFRYAEAPPRTRPAKLSWQELKALGDDAREQYNEERKDWHANIGPLDTPQLHSSHESMWEIVDSNRQDTGHAKGAIALDAYPGLGKTTIADSFGFKYHRALLARNGPTTEEGDERIPVCHIGLTSNTTMRTLSMMICDFYGHPATTGSAATFGRRALDCVLSCDTQLVIIDDVHFLNARSKDGLAVVNHFKWLANELPVTFLFVGVDLKARGLMSEGLSASTAARAQTARRWTRLTVAPFDISTRRGHIAWIQLLLGIEENIVLARSHPGMIADDLSDYLFARSTGHIGSLMSLITRGCYHAISSEAEQLTKKLLNEVRIDEAAEQARVALQSAMEQGLLTTRNRSVTPARTKSLSRQG
ncbi:TniB protein [Rhodococcus sp. OK611]|jgi:hypothetical protein|uniref:AAA family ATPase n=1 Tax=unclassified Rhodococcus (in: high G+C Gram-positive bacteria) TaxID=192944 RepID=UPI000BCE5E9E|nr:MULTISPECIES: AAA family ATPase [unclassified Rhodococcus (in: high G+C Gram-positive bacteria)]PTR44714.1 TniB protein [Rhodococcus sp. OK611]SNX90155.1 TniB protein [Rhodococcus sp. OK270]